MLHSRSPIYWLCSSTLTKLHRQPLFPIQPSRTPSSGHLISRIIFHTCTVTQLMLISTYNFCWPSEGKNIDKRLLHLEKPIRYLQIRGNLCLFAFCQNCIDCLTRNEYILIPFLVSFPYEITKRKISESKLPVLTLPILGELTSCTSPSMIRTLYNRASPELCSTSVLDNVAWPWVGDYWPIEQLLLIQRILRKPFWDLIGVFIEDQELAFNLKD